MLSQKLLQNRGVEPAVVTTDLDTISPLPVISPKPKPKVKIINQIIFINFYPPLIKFIMSSVILFR